MQSPGAIRQEWDYQDQAGEVQVNFFVGGRRRVFDITLRVFVIELLHSLDKYIMHDENLSKASEM